MKTADVLFSNNMENKLVRALPNTYNNKAVTATKVTALLNNKGNVSVEFIHRPLLTTKLLGNNFVDFSTFKAFLHYIEEKYCVFPKGNNSVEKGNSFVVSSIISNNI